MNIHAIFCHFFEFTGRLYKSSAAGAAAKREEKAFDRKDFESGDGSTGFRKRPRIKETKK